jgi:hypothetical protein
MRLGQTKGQRSTRRIPRRTDHCPPFVPGPQRRFSCFSRLAARFSLALFAGFFFASFLRSMPLLTASPSERFPADGCPGASPASLAVRASWQLLAASLGAGSSADARCLQMVPNPTSYPTGCRPPACGLFANSARQRLDLARDDLGAGLLRGAPRPPVPRTEQVDDGPGERRWRVAISEAEPVQQLLRFDRVAR